MLSSKKSEKSEVSVACRVRDFEVIDTVALGVAFSWDKEGQPITSVIFERNSPLPSVKLLTFYRYRSPSQSQ